MFYAVSIEMECPHAVPTFGVAIVVVAFASQSLGFEAGAIIRKIDVDKRIAIVFANGRDRTVKIAANAKIQDRDGKKLNGGLGAKELLTGATVTLNVETDGNMPTIVAIRLGGNINAPAPPSVGMSTVGFKPLTEMTAQDRYKGEDGGLYGGGRNELSDSLRAVAKQETAKIVPLGVGDEPAADGTIGLVLISMSNATQEFSRFKQLADADARKSPLVAIVDGAQESIRLSASQRNRPSPGVFLRISHVMGFWNLSTRC